MKWLEEKVSLQGDRKRMLKCIWMPSFFIAGKLVETGRQLILKPVSGYLYQKKYQSAEKMVEALMM